MEVKVKLQQIIVKDKRTGEEFTLVTTRTAKDIAEYLQESEKEEMRWKVEEAVVEACEDYLHHTD